MSLDGIGTLRQFAHRHRDDYFAQTPELTVSKAEYDRIYPPESRADMWMEALRQAVVARRSLSRHTLDDLWRRYPGFWQRVLWHDYGQGDWFMACWPKGYVRPDLRQRYREQADEVKLVRAARRTVTTH